MRSSVKTRRPGNLNRLGAIHTADERYSGPDRVDVACDSGGVFSPSDELHEFGESGYCDWHRYRRLYVEEMARSQSQSHHRGQWLELLQRKGAVLCCSCRRADRCLRVTLAMLLEALGAAERLPAMYLGETRG